jgi:hypothetical protein
VGPSSPSASFVVHAISGELLTLPPIALPNKPGDDEDEYEYDQRSNRVFK